MKKWNWRLFLELLSVSISFCETFMKAITQFCFQRTLANNVLIIKVIESWIKLSEMLLKRQYGVNLTINATKLMVHRVILYQTFRSVYAPCRGSGVSSALNSNKHPIKSWNTSVSTPFLLQEEMNIEKEDVEKKCLKGRYAETKQCKRALGYGDAKATSRLVREQHIDSGWLLLCIQEVA